MAEVDILGDTELREFVIAAVVVCEGDLLVVAPLDLDLFNYGLLAYLVLDRLFWGDKTLAYLATRLVASFF